MIIDDTHINARLFEDGKYVIRINNSSHGATGTFLVIYQNKEYFPKETLTITEDQYEYNISIYIEQRDNDPPDYNNDTTDTTNIQPKADAGGPYHQIVNNVVYFNGSASNDTDGTIVSYKWNFGDKTEGFGVTTTHKYTDVGNYTVTLTVTDNKSKTDIDNTYAYITETLNYPPTQPAINGTLKGSVNILYNYTIFSTDIENDTIQYVIDWGDNSELTISQFLPNAINYITNHKWIYPGIFTINFYAIDEKDAISPSTKQIILIDTIYCGEIGYITDYTGDKIYDLFHSNTTGEEAPVEQQNQLFLIDIDNDGKYDFQYDIITFNLSPYTQTNTKKENASLIALIDHYIPFVIVIAAIVIIGLIVSFSRITSSYVSIPKELLA